MGGVGKNISDREIGGDERRYISTGLETCQLAWETMRRKFAHTQTKPETVATFCKLHSYHYLLTDTHTHTQQNPPSKL